MTEINSPPVEHSAGQPELSIDVNLRAGLALLRQAHLYARDAGADLWDFALETDHLYETGLTISDLRWLITKGFAEHGKETTLYGDPHRSFRRSGGLNFVPTTCFVLTPNGAEFARKVLRGPAAAQEAAATHPRPCPLGRPAADHTAMSPPRISSPRDSRVPSLRSQGQKSQSTPDRHQISA